MLPRVDGGAAADREDPVGVDGYVDVHRGHLRPPGDVRHVERAPPLARDHERPCDAELGERRAELADPPADDHGSVSRANSTNARAARVSVRPRRTDEQDLALEVEPIDARFDERAGGEVRLDRRARDEGDAVPGAHGVRDRLLQAELDAHVEIAQSRARAAQRFLDHLADTGAVLHQDQVLPTQIVERDRPAGERMPRRADEDDRVTQERLVLDAAVTRRRADDTELERAVGDALDDGLRVEDGERDVQLRMLLGEPAEERREDDAAGPGRRADLERPGELAGRVVGELVDDLFFERKQPLRRPVELGTGLRRLDAAAGAVEQLRAEPLLERPHLEAHSRLRDAEPLGRLGERLALDHLAERPQLPRVHKDSL